MKTSLIITTYNRPDVLELCLRSLARQSQQPDEVLIADDGSGPETTEVVRSYARVSPVPVLHVWQADLGFRAARSRNRALAAASGDYVVFVDGDLIMHQHFIQDHKRAARSGFFVQGVRLLTGSAARDRMLREGLLDLPFLFPDVARRRHLIRSSLLSRLSAAVGRGRRGIHSDNQGYWRADLVRVNGWNEQMVGWGFEDDEMAVRMTSAGIRRRNLRFNALAIHMYHPSRKPRDLNPNRQLLEEATARHAQRCDLGLDQHLAAFARGLPADAISPY